MSADTVHLDKTNKVGTCLPGERTQLVCVVCCMYICVYIYRYAECMCIVCVCAWGGGKGGSVARSTRTQVLDLKGLAHVTRNRIPCTVCKLLVTLSITS